MRRPPRGTARRCGARTRSPGQSSGTTSASRTATPSTWQRCVDTSARSKLRRGRPASSTTSPRRQRPAPVDDVNGPPPSTDSPSRSRSSATGRTRRVLNPGPLAAMGPTRQRTLRSEGRRVLRAPSKGEATRHRASAGSSVPHNPPSLLGAPMRIGSRQLPRVHDSAASSIRQGPCPAPMRRSRRRNLTPGLLNCVFSRGYDFGGGTVDGSRPVCIGCSFLAA